jgi:hypothetical protein
MRDHQPGFKAELTALLHMYGLDGGSETSASLLADYLVQCLAVFDVMTVAQREAWYGRPLDQPRTEKGEAWNSS